MDKISLLLEKLNALLAALFAKVGALFIKVIPQKTINKSKTIVNKTQYPFVKAKYLAKKSTKKLKEKSQKLTATVKSEEFKTKVAEKKKTISESLKKNVSKAGAAAVFAFLLSKLSNVKAWLLGLSPKAFLTTVSLTAVMSICGIEAFYSGKRIYKETVGRKPASVQEIPKGRPEYYKTDRRQTSLEEITLPIYAKTDAGDISRLLFDFNVQFSNRYLVHMIRANESEVKSYINTQLEPFTADFPFTLEGKEVIKDKVKMELNNFLQEKDAEGYVEEVYISHIIAG